MSLLISGALEGSRTLLNTSSAHPGSGTPSAPSPSPHPPDQMAAVRTSRAAQGVPATTFWDHAGKLNAKGTVAGRRARVWNLGRRGPAGAPHQDPAARGHHRCRHQVFDPACRRVVSRGGETSSPPRTTALVNQKIGAAQVVDEAINRETGIRSESDQGLTSIAALGANARAASRRAEAGRPTAAARPTVRKCWRRLLKLAAIMD